MRHYRHRFSFSPGFHLPLKLMTLIIPGLASREVEVEEETK